MKSNDHIAGAGAPLSASVLPLEPVLTLTGFGAGGMAWRTSSAEPSRERSASCCIRMARDRQVVFKSEGAGCHHGFPVEGPRDLDRDQAVPRKGRTQFKRQIAEQSLLLTAVSRWRLRTIAVNCGG